MNILSEQNIKNNQQVNNQSLVINKQKLQKMYSLKDLLSDKQQKSEINIVEQQKRKSHRLGQKYRIKLQTTNKLSELSRKSSGKIESQFRLKSLKNFINHIETDIFTTSQHQSVKKITDDIKKNMYKSKCLLNARRVGNRSQIITELRHKINEQMRYNSFDILGSLKNRQYNQFEGMKNSILSQIQGEDQKMKENKRIIKIKTNKFHLLPKIQKNNESVTFIPSQFVALVRQEPDDNFKSKIISRTSHQLDSKSRKKIQQILSMKYADKPHKFATFR